jgi:hypothetical protein
MRNSFITAAMAAVFVFVATDVGHAKKYNQSSTSNSSVIVPLFLSSTKKKPANIQGRTVTTPSGPQKDTGDAGTTKSRK